MECIWRYPGLLVGKRIKEIGDSYGILNLLVVDRRIMCST